MKQKLKKIFENAVWWSGVVMVGLVLGASLQFVRAWTEPTEAPPGGNVGAPINTSPIGQFKHGVLQLLGLTLYNDPAVSGVDVTGKVLTAQNAYGATAWAAGGGSSGGSYTAFGTKSCAPEWTVAYTGDALATYARASGTNNIAGGGGIVCTAGLTNTHSDSVIGMKWFTSWGAATQNSIPCAVCVK